MNTNIYVSVTSSVPKNWNGIISRDLVAVKYVCLSVKLPLPQTPQRQSRLFCRYYDNARHPKYVIGPVKQEDEWDHPHIIRYHDVVSNREMEKVKELARPRVRGNTRNVCLSVCPSVVTKKASVIKL